MKLQLQRSDLRRGRSGDSGHDTGAGRSTAVVVVNGRVDVLLGLGGEDAGAGGASAVVVVDRRVLENEINAVPQGEKAKSLTVCSVESLAVKVVKESIAGWRGEATGGGQLLEYEQPAGALYSACFPGEVQSAARRSRWWVGLSGLDNNPGGV